MKVVMPIGVRTHGIVPQNREKKLSELEIEGRTQINQNIGQLDYFEEYWRFEKMGYHTQLIEKKIS